MDTKTLCLGVLMLGDASGYDVRKYLEENFGHFMDISLNAVYPALKTLEKDGLVTFKVVRQSNYPDKKVYSLTDEGKMTFSGKLQVLPPRHKVRSQLMLLMFFADMLPAFRIKEIIDERIKELNHWLKVCSECIENIEIEKSGDGPSFLVDYAMAVMEAEIKFLDKNKDSLIKKREG